MSIERQGHIGMGSHQLIETLKDNLRSIATAIALGNVGKIHAIRAWRVATGVTLKDAKDYIESLSSRAERTQEDSRVQRLEDKLHYLERRVDTLERTRG